MISIERIKSLLIQLKSPSFFINGNDAVKICGAAIIELSDRIEALEKPVGIPAEPLPKHDTLEQMNMHDTAPKLPFCSICGTEFSTLSKSCKCAPLPSHDLSHAISLLAATECVTTNEWCVDNIIAVIAILKAYQKAGAK